MRCLYHWCRLYRPVGSPASGAKELRCGPAGCPPHRLGRIGAQWRQLGLEANQLVRDLIKQHKIECDFKPGSFMPITGPGIPAIPNARPNTCILTAGGCSGEGLGMGTYAGYEMAQAIDGACHVVLFPARQVLKPV